MHTEKWQRRRRAVEKPCIRAYLRLCHFSVCVFSPRRERLLILLLDEVEESLAPGYVMLVDDYHTCPRALNANTSGRNLFDQETMGKILKFESGGRPEYRSRTKSKIS
jgi:hypothetical protein